MERKQKISYVIPCYRSEHTIGDVVADISQTMGARPEYDYEIILVNDGSPDGTGTAITKLAHRDSHVLAIQLMRNFGQASAIMAGYHYVSGDIVVNLDDDGQTDPKQVFTLLDALTDDMDVIYARYDSKKHSWFRNFGTRVNDRMADHLIGKPQELIFTSYFCARRQVIDEVIKYDKPYPYIDGLIMRVTRRVGDAPIHHKEREEGESGYTFGKLLSLWMDGFTAFSVKPLRVATIFGFIVAAIGFIYGIVTVVQQLTSPSEVSGWASLISAVVFLGGMNMVLIGLVGEYIGRIYISQNNAPQFIVRETIGGQEDHG